MSFAPVSMKASDSLSAYRIVTPSAGNTVALADTTTDYPIGVTADEATAANQGVPVIVSGIAKVQFNDTCAVGGLVTTNASGQGIPAVATTAGIYVVGVLVGPAVSATGTIADVLVNPFQLQIP